MKGRGKWRPDSFCILKFSSSPFFRVLEVPPHLIPHSLFLFFFSFETGSQVGIYTILLCGSDWPQTYGPLASGSHILELQAYTTMFVSPICLQ